MVGQAGQRSGEDLGHWLFDGRWCEQVSFVKLPYLQALMRDYSLAFADILSFIQARWGSLSLAPQDWARDENFHQLIRHITFGEYPAGSYEWHAYLNTLYERHTIPAWEFSNAADQTFALHIPFFRSWRGHKYDLPDRAVHPFGAEYGQGNHGMSGYQKSLEWVERHGWHDVASRYRYP